MIRKPIRKKSLRTYPKLKAEAEKWVHTYVRLRDCLKTTNTLHHGLCFTCGADTEYKYLQAGHFQHGKLDFDEDNLNGQCVACNKWKHGKLDQYAIRLIRERGQAWMNDLIFRSNQIQKKTRQELEEIAETYKQKVLDLHNAL